MKFSKSDLKNKLQLINLSFFFWKMHAFQYCIPSLFKITENNNFIVNYIEVVFGRELNYLIPSQTPPYYNLQ